MRLRTQNITKEQKDYSQMVDEYNHSRNNWKTYQKNLEEVTENELINYYLYMIKAEEARLAYLQKKIREAEV